MWLPLNSKGAGHPPETPSVYLQRTQPPFVMGEEGIDKALVVKGTRALGDTSLGAVPRRRQRACHTLGLLDLSPSPVL